MAFNLDPFNDQISMSSLTQAVDQNTKAIQSLIQSLPLSVVSGQPVSQSVATNAQSVMSQIGFPISYTNLLEIFLAARQTGEIFPYYVRQTVLVPAGQSATLITTVPLGDLSSTVYMHSMRVDTNTTEFLVSLQADTEPPFLVEVPMNFNVDILGAFIPPVATKVTHTLINNDSVDITFTAEEQLAVMTADFTNSVYKPIMEGQYRLLQSLGSAIVAKGGVL